MGDGERGGERRDRVEREWKGKVGEGGGVRTKGEGRRKRGEGRRKRGEEGLVHSLHHEQWRQPVYRL